MMWAIVRDSDERACLEDVHLLERDGPFIISRVVMAESQLLVDKTYEVQRESGTESLRNQGLFRKACQNAPPGRAGFFTFGISLPQIPDPVYHSCEMNNIAALITCVGLWCLLAAQGCNQSSSQQSSAAPLPISITVASQDRALFVSWYSDDPINDSKLEYSVEGKDSKGHIVSRRCPNHGGCLLAPLENDIVWHVSLRGVIDGIPSRIGQSGGTPRARSQYAYFNYASWLLPNFHIFTSWDAADSWIKLNGTQPDALRYRGQSVSDWGQDIRNGFYTYGQSPEYAFVLTRDLDSEFNMDQPYRDPNEVRRSLRRIIWQTDDPFLEISTPHVEGKETVIWDKYPDCRMTNATLKASADDPETTVASFITCNRAEQRGMAVYLEGHGGFALDIGADVIGYLADLGWEVLVLDMPMSGANYYVAQPSSYHFSYGLNDSGGHLPIAKFMMPIKLAIDWALSMSREPQSRLIMIGRSGGGWASTLYSSLDKRIEYSVAIAGLTPQSIRLERDAPSDTGDYEQHEPALYSYLPYEHLMISAGSKGAFYIYNENDPCCFQVHSDSPFLKFLEGAARAYKKNIGFYIDPDNTEHSASPKALEAMRVFIDGP